MLGGIIELVYNELTYHFEERVAVQIFEE